MRIALFGALAAQLSTQFSWQKLMSLAIGSVIVLAIIIICKYAKANYYNNYQSDVETAFKQTAYFENSVLTETDMIHLPEMVRKYLRFTGSVGKSKVNNLKIKFTGKIRKDEQSEWMPFTSQQYNFMQISTRLFFMKAVMKNMPVAGYHCFKNGKASMDIRLLSLIKVQFQDGPEMDLSETVTFFNDMCCLAPATLIDKRIKWLTVEDHHVQASFTNNDITVSAWLYFNDEGALINFISQDRYAADKGKQLPWSTPLIDYQQINGYKLMQNAETIYSYPDRDLCYGTFRLVSVKYNCREID